jgi:hypothetical protein
MTSESTVALVPNVSDHLLLTQKSVLCSPQRQYCPYIMRVLFPLLLA